MLFFQALAHVYLFGVFIAAVNYLYTLVSKYGDSDGEIEMRKAWNLFKLSLTWHCLLDLILVKGYLLYKNKNSHK